jgi:hypothetical protein
MVGEARAVVSVVAPERRYSWAKTGGGGIGGAGGFGKGMAAGDVIVVPINMEKSRMMEHIVNGTQIVYQLAVAAAAVNSF